MFIVENLGSTKKTQQLTLRSILTVSVQTKDDEGLKKGYRSLREVVVEVFSLKLQSTKHHSGQLCEE